MIAIVVLLFVAAPLVLIRYSQASWITQRQKKLLAGVLYMAMALSTGLGMLLEGSLGEPPAEDVVSASVFTNPA